MHKNKTAMLLSDLLKNIDVVRVVGNSQVSVSGIQSDSRKVEKGHVIANVKPKTDLI